MICLNWAFIVAAVSGKKSVSASVSASASKKSSKSGSGESSGDGAGIWQFRRPERQIWLAALLMVGLGYFSVLGSRYAESGVFPDFHAWTMVVFWALSLLLLHVVLLVSRSRVDPVVTGLTMTLCGLGMLAQYRMQVYEGVFSGDGWKSPGALAYPFGFLGLMATHQIFRGGRYQVLRRPWILWLMVCLGVVGVVLVTGRRFRGAMMASGNMTPTEILKLLVPMAVAGFLASRRNLRQSGKAPKARSRSRKTRKADGAGGNAEIFAWGGFLFGLVLIFGGLVYQKDLGMVLILMTAVGFQIFAGTGSWWVLPVMAGGMFGGITVIQLVFPHALRRFDVWLNPFNDPTGAGWQILQSFSGMYAGGLWGQGWGQGDPERIPIAKSDFIYSVIGEEMGFFGCLLVILAFGLLIYRTYRIAENSESDFGRLLGSGLVSVMAVQVIINIAGVVKVIPMTGVPLIFVSHGGASLVTTLAISGLIMGLADSICSGNYSSPAASAKSKPSSPSRGKSKSDTKTGSPVRKTVKKRNQ